jgi:hypothetical protein
MTSIITDDFLQEKIWQNESFDNAKAEFIKLIKSVNINQKDKMKMVREAMNVSTKTKLDQYALNAKFKFEGLGVI